MENLVSQSDVLFVLLGAVMVLAMHAGFAFLEVGTVREKNQVKDVGTGLECGISIKDFLNISIFKVIRFNIRIYLTKIILVKNQIRNYSIFYHVSFPDLSELWRPNSRHRFII